MSLCLLWLRLLHFKSFLQKIYLWSLAGVILCCSETFTNPLWFKTFLLDGSARISMFLGTLKKEPQARLLTLAETILMQNFIDFFFEKRKSTKWKCQNSSPAQCSHKDGSKLPMATALKAFKATKSSASRSRWFDAWPYMCCCCCCIMCFPGEDKCFGPMGGS